jgi:hypothetical protein
MVSNAGFRPQELQRRKFQEVAAVVDKQARAIVTTREVLADLSARVDLVQHRVSFRDRSFWGRLRWLFLGWRRSNPK